MSAPRQLPPPSNPHLLPILVAVTYLAAVIAFWGIASLLLDVEVIAEPDAGALLGPAMAAAATVVTWLAVRSRPRTLLVRAVGAAAFVFVAMLVVGAVAYSVVRGNLAWLLFFPAGHATSPFVLGAAVLSALAVVVTWLLRAGGPKPFDRTPSAS
jgi:hypothetical protein